MRSVSIPTIALMSASAVSIILITTSTACDAFVPLTATSRTQSITTTSSEREKIDGVLFGLQKRYKTSCILKSKQDDGSSSVLSMDEVESRISEMKVVELRAELKSRGQSTSGLKKVLQERLLDFYHTEIATTEDENKNEDISTLVDGGDEVTNNDEQQKETTWEVDDDEEEYEGDNGFDIFIANDDDDSLPSGLLQSKQKWKKKTYLLMEDVRKLVHSKDPTIRRRGPKRGGDAVRRIKRWISLSQSSSSFPASFGDDFDASYNDAEDDDHITTIIDLDSDCFTEFQNFQRSTLLRAYNLWIHAIAKSDADDAGHQAEQVLQEMQQNIPNGGPSPNRVTIASVMDAHAHSARVSSSKSGAKAAESFLFKLLESDGVNDDDDDMPWSHDDENSLRDSLILTCDSMLNALAREGTMDSAERAHLMILRLEEYQRQLEKERQRKQSKKARRTSKESETANESTNAGKRPISYATVMNAWANVGSAKAAEQAEATLERLVQRAKTERKENKNLDYERSKLVDIQPDAFVFNSVIQCWATSGDIRAGKKSLRLLEQMKELACTSTTDENDSTESRICFDTHPDIITYNTVLSAWSHCGKKNAALQAEKIVKEMVAEQQKYEGIEFETGEKAPVVANTITFNSVLHAWSKSKLDGATDRAEKLLEYMIQSNNSEIKPDIYSFTCVMDAWAKSKEPNKALRTRELLDRLIQMRSEALVKKDKRKADALKPTQIPYNTVLNACAFSAMHTSEQERREAIQIAVDTYKTMSSRVSAFDRRGDVGIVSRDTVSYGLMLKSIANLMPRGTVRNRMALQIFRECCDDGLVGYLVWNEIRRAVPIKLLDETYRLKRHCGSLEVRDLPKSWTANSRERRSSKQRKREENDHKRKSRGKNNREKQEESEDKTFIIERSFATGKDL